MTENAPIQKTCLQCNSPEYEPGYKIHLCRPCRTRFSSYPIDNKIKWGGVLLALIVCLSFFRFPEQFKAAINYEKGLAHFSNREFIDAETAFSHIPHTTSRVHMLTANYYNMYSRDMLHTHIEQLEQDATYKRDADLYMEVETIKAMMVRDDAQAESIDTAMTLYAAQQIPQADSIFASVMNTCPGYLTSYIMHAKCLRRQQQYAAATAVCNKALEYNHQLPAALREKDTIQMTINNPAL